MRFYVCMRVHLGMCTRFNIRGNVHISCAYTSKSLSINAFISLIIFMAAKLAIRLPKSIIYTHGKFTT